jgi:hypothetical protein
MFGICSISCCAKLKESILDFFPYWQQLCLIAAGHGLIFAPERTEVSLVGIHKSPLAEDARSKIQGCGCQGMGPARSVTSNTMPFALWDAIFLR